MSISQQINEVMDNNVVVKDTPNLARAQKHDSKYFFEKQSRMLLLAFYLQFHICFDGLVTAWPLCKYMYMEPEKPKRATEILILHTTPVLILLSVCQYQVVESCVVPTALRMMKKL